MISVPFPLCKFLGEGEKEPSERTISLVAIGDSYELLRQLNLK